MPATLVDVVGSAALVTLSDRGGVSSHLGVDYLSPARTGDAVEIEAVVARAGRRAGTALVSLTTAAADGVAAADGGGGVAQQQQQQRVAHGTHLKALVPQSDVSALWAAAAAAAAEGRSVGRGGGSGGDGQRQQRQRQEWPQSKL